MYSKFKTAVFGESSVDKVQRLKYYLQATSDYDLIRVNNYYSNSITNLGIGVSAPYTPTAIPWGGVDTIQAINIENQLKSIPSTPKIINSFSTVDLQPPPHPLAPLSLTRKGGGWRARVGTMNGMNQYLQQVRYY